MLELAVVNKSVEKGVTDDVPAIVTVSEAAVVVMDIPSLPTRVRVSVAESAATVVWPLTAILPNELPPVLLFVIVISSELASVARVIPVPATRVKVSDVESADTVVCPLTAMLAKALSPAVPQLKFPLPSVFHA